MQKPAANGYNRKVTTSHKYRRIAESIRQQITNGKLIAGDFLPTSKQLARQYETTPVTIDRAIGVLVSEGLVSRTPGVGTTVVDPYAQPNGGSGARSLVGALLQAQTESHYWERLLEGINDVLRPAGISTLIGYHKQSHDTALEYGSLFRDQGASLVFFAPFDRPTRDQYEHDNAVAVHGLREMGLQVVMLDRYIESVPGHFVSEYCYSQGTDMVRRLIHAGYTSPLCLSTDYVSVIGARERAFLDGCRDAGIGDGESRVVRIPLADFQERRYDEIVERLAGTGRHDLVVCLNSRIFNTMIYLMARESGERSPLPGVRLAGFVDIELMDLRDVVGYVEQPVREIGRAAGRMVTRLRDEPPGEYHHTLVPCELRMLDE